MKTVNPTEEQAIWADLEIGLLAHLDLQVFDSSYTHEIQMRELRSPELFNPVDLDTDKWCSIAAKSGAKYFVLTAKHCSGFCLWPTKVHDFSVASSPWKNGKGDVVKDFFASCKKYGIKPGLYYSVSTNGYYKVYQNGKPSQDSPLSQQEYNDVVIRQLTELWTLYGPVFEIWFDGGVIPVSEGGPDVEGLMKKLQPNAVVFQGPPGTKSLIRWVGNELATPDKDCSATVRGDYRFFHGGTEQLGCGDQYGDLWSMAECDMPARDASKAYLGGWFWRKGEDQFVFDKDKLFERYIGAAGHNGNLLIGVVIDDRGLIPKTDTEALLGLGEHLRKAFNEEKKIDAKGMRLFVPENRRIDYVVISEDIRFGERITGFELKRNNETIEKGKVIGHKRIILTGGLNGGEYELVVLSSKDEPIIKQFCAY